MSMAALPRRVPLAAVAGLVLVALAGVALPVLLADLRRSRTADASVPLDPAAVDAGRAVYGASCASCHGLRLEGQPQWEKANAAGRLPAPPLDDRGHAWQHSDAELLHIIGFSLADQSPPGYVSDMPAFQGRLTPAAMDSVLAYVKSQWSPRVRLYQSMLSSGGPSAAPWPADWRFPVSCKAARAQALKAARQRGS
jgi:mono/diheme cytochrome c family protein